LRGGKPQTAGLETLAVWSFRRDDEHTRERGKKFLKRRIDEVRKRAVGRGRYLPKKKQNPARRRKVARRIGKRKEEKRKTERKDHARPLPTMKPNQCQMENS